MRLPASGAAYLDCASCFWRARGCVSSWSSRKRHSTGRSGVGWGGRRTCDRCTTWPGEMVRDNGIGGRKECRFRGGLQKNQEDTDFWYMGYWHRQRKRELPVVLIKFWRSVRHTINAQDMWLNGPNMTTGKIFGGLFHTHTYISVEQVSTVNLSLCDTYRPWLDLLLGKHWRSRTKSVWGTHPLQQHQVTEKLIMRRSNNATAAAHEFALYTWLNKTTNMTNTTNTRSDVSCLSLNCTKSVRHVQRRW